MMDFPEASSNGVPECFFTSVFHLHKRFRALFPSFRSGNPFSRRHFTNDVVNSLFSVFINSSVDFIPRNEMNSTLEAVIPPYPMESYLGIDPVSLVLVLEAVTEAVAIATFLAGRPSSYSLLLL